MFGLYASDMQVRPVQTIIEDYLLFGKCTNLPKHSWGLQLARKAYQHTQELNEWIIKYAIGWQLDRIHPIDKAILKVAFYELLYSSLDAKIIVNEAIELSKRYSTPESSKFINGILGHYLEDCPSRLDQE